MLTLAEAFQKAEALLKASGDVARDLMQAPPEEEEEVEVDLAELPLPNEEPQ